MIYDITALKRKVISLYPFFGSIAADVEYQETEDIKSIKSDGISSTIRNICPVCLPQTRFWYWLTNCVISLLNTQQEAKARIQ